ncbi:MAG: cyclic pyranopterin monophosphate synthase MoaC [Nanoarchaeota archaeon]|nr:cyclic pyranopterin monophosphate synthase MoaC [Nanoarchaeota archaeon]
MKDLSSKRQVVREVITSGKIFLKEKTIKRIVDKEIEDGDVLAQAEIAAINAAKQTSGLIPMCHQIPLESIQVTFDVQDKFIEVKSTVKATAKSGVEMESMMATAVALNTVLQMVKEHEEDDNGQFPDAWITDMRIEKKERRTPQMPKEFSPL